jgi:hypothetical protein
MWSKPKRRSAIIKSIPAPTKGLNDYDSIANMAPNYALDMLNMFPSAKSLRVRSGYQEWITGLDSVCKTLMSYNASNGANKLWVATDAGIYDATTSGAAPAATVALTNGYLDSINYSNVAGQYLIAVNGTDIGKIYDGATWANMATTGASTQDMIAVHSYNKRLWFIQKDSMVAWYLPVDAITGVLTPFYLGGTFTMGGFLQNIFTWSIDSGSGLDDVLVFQSSKGEITGYVGPDPSLATTFELKASYFVGAPLGGRVTDDLGGDVAMLTIGGVVPISKVVGGTQAISRDEDTLSKNISQTFNDILSTRGQLPNWEIRNFPALTSLYVNFPATGGSAALQFVMNTLTGAWTKYDLPMRSMTEHNQTLYFSDELNRILVMEVSNNLDNLAIDGSFGTFIVSGVQVAYNYFELLGTNKAFNMIRPLFISQYAPAILTNVSVDFNPNYIIGIPQPVGGPSSIDFWDTALWDVNNWFAPNAPTAADVWDTGIWDTTLWSPPVNAQYEWIGVGQMGYAASLAIKLSTNAPTEFVSCDWSIVPGMSL